MLEKVISQVQFEIEQIDRLFQSYAALLEIPKKHVPNLVEMTALAAVLHSFYNGLENLFQTIAKGIDAQISTSSQWHRHLLTQWHRHLLTQMATVQNHRKAVLTPETSSRPSEYLAFRHFFRHAYSFFMEWDEMEKLVIPLAEVWVITRGELEAFLKSLNSNQTNNSSEFSS